ncbi:TPR-like protein [Mycena vulgaris]|nr:TPR-like protein [Mycena vulgaris]
MCDDEDLEEEASLWQDDLMDEETSMGSDDSAVDFPSDQSTDSDSDSEEYTPTRANVDKEDELRIEGDFHRLVKSIRLNNDAVPSTFLTKDWDFNAIDSQSDTQFNDGITISSTVRMGKQEKKKPRLLHLSSEVESLLGDGNLAYIEGDLSESMRIMLEVIRIEPRAVSAWSTLAQCYEDRNQGPEALQLRIMAAHLTHDADEWDRLAQQSKDLECNLQALYCWGKATKLDPSKVSAQWERVSLARDVGDLKTARTALLAIIQQNPYDLAALSEIRPILIETSDLETCITLFQGAFEHYQKTYPSGFRYDPTTDQGILGGGFGQMEIFVLADLYNTVGHHGRAIDVIRCGFRWLQGRAEHRYWDMCDDDREYDQEVLDRVVQSGMQPGMFPLGVNARHRLAVARIKMREPEEARLHVKAILSEDLLDYAPLFVEIADAYFEEEMYSEAQPIYDLLGSDPNTNSFYVLLQTAACLRMLGELQEAVAVYEHIRLLDPSHNEAKMKGAEIYEILNEPKRALALVYEVIDSRMRNWRSKDQTAPPVSTRPSGSLFFEGKTTESKSSRKGAVASAEELKELEVEIEEQYLQDYRKVKKLWPRISKAEIDDSARDWLFHAGRLIDGFRETRQLFSSAGSFRGMFPSRNNRRTKNKKADEDRMASRLQLQIRHGEIDQAETLTEIFRGLHFHEWLELFFQYCFLLTSGGQFDAAHEILTQISAALPYRSRQFQDSIRLATVTCAVAARRFPVVVEQCRKLMQSHQLNNEPLRILLAAIASGGESTDAFIIHPLQSVVRRELKFSRIVAECPERIIWTSRVKRFTILPVSQTDEPNEEEDIETDDSIEDLHRLPEAKYNPVITSLYAQMFLMTKTYQKALFFLLHAYELSPDDPMICLCLAIASIGRAMQRTADNRHHLVTQGMAFLTRYRHLRQEQPGGIGEVEFNFGRTFQQLGLYSHAVSHYDKVLELDATISTTASVVREAAYNLSLIYAMTGATRLANSMYRRWLSF